MSTIGHLHYTENVEVYQDTEEKVFNEYGDVIGGYFWIAIKDKNLDGFGIEFDRHETTLKIEHIDGINILFIDNKMINYVGGNRHGIKIQINNTFKESEELLEELKEIK